MTAMKGPFLWKHPALTTRDTGPQFRGLSRWSPKDQGPRKAHSPLVLASLQAPQSQRAVIFWAGTLPGRKMQVPTQIPPGCFTTSKSAWMVVRARKGRAIQGGKRDLWGWQRGMGSSTGSSRPFHPRSSASFGLYLERRGRASHPLLPYLSALLFL